MKKLLMTAFHTLELIDGEIPVPGKEEAVIRVVYGGICGSDIHILSGEHPTAAPPLVLGHEFCGEIYAINSDVRTDLKAGDSVSAHMIVPCEACEGCHQGKPNQCRNLKAYGVVRDGFHSQYVVVPANKIVKFNDEIDKKITALVEPLAVAVHDIRRSGLLAGEDVFITGCGTIGIMIAMVARLSGADKVVLAEMDADRIAIGKKLGFEVLDVRDSDFQNKALACTGGLRYDRVFEVTASQGGFDTCTDLVKTGGVMVQVGMPKGRFSIDINKYIYSEVDLRGVRMHTFTSFQAAAKIINSGILSRQLAEVKPEVYPLDKALDAFQAAKTNKSLLKVLIDFTNFSSQE